MQPTYRKFRKKKVMCKQLRTDGAAWLRAPICCPCISSLLSTTE